MEPVPVYVCIRVISLATQPEERDVIEYLTGGDPPAATRNFGEAFIGSRNEVLLNWWRLPPNDRLPWDCVRHRWR